jgi:DNA topoisomerase-1
MTIKNNRNYVVRKLRNNNPKKPYYVDKKGKNLNNQNTVKYLKQWRIPPAYPEVKIFLNVNDKKDDVFYAVGTDAKGRKQQLYTTYHNTRRESTKYCKVLEVGRHYDKLFKKINKDLKQKTITKNKLIAILLNIMIECQFRPGHEKYRDQYKSFGLTTLQKQHITNKNGKLFIKFLGKKGVNNECLFCNSNTIAELQKVMKNKKNNDDVFTHKKLKVKPEDINNYLREFGGITAKNIRTWDANLQFINYARKMNAPLSDKVTARKKQMTAVVEHVAKKLHHSVAICKKSYLDDDLFTMMVDKPDKFTTMFLASKNSSDKVLVKYFEKKCRLINKNK